MRVRDLMNYLTEFMDNKGKVGTGLGDDSVLMQVGNHLEEIKRIEVQESTIIGANSMRVVLKPMREKRIISPTPQDL